MFIVLVGLIGLLVGSGLAILVEVVPDSINQGHSPFRCGSCGERRGLGALSPLPGATSCSACEAKSSVARLPTVLVTGAVFVLAAAVVGNRWQILPVLLFASSLIALSAVDVARFRLPDRIIFPSLLASVVLIAVLSASFGEIDHVWRGLITGLAYAGVLFVFNIISPAGLAFGDVKLSLLLGLFLGWVADSGIDAARLVVWALLAGMIFGIFSGVLVGLGRRTFGPDFLPDPDFPVEEGEVTPLLKTAFPFGPALALSAFGLVVFSARLLEGTGILA